MSKSEIEKSFLSDYFSKLPEPNKYPYADYLVPANQEPILGKRVEFTPTASVKFETLRFTKVRFADIGFLWTIKSFFFDHTYVYVFGKIETI
jgi:hypothetical protein